MDPHRLSDTRRRLRPLHQGRHAALCAEMLLVLVLSGCTSAPPWPAPVPVSAPGAAGQAACPDLRGVYLDTARDSQGCSALDARACQSLSFHLFSGHVREADGVSNVPTPHDDWPAATQVQIEQTHAGLLRVTAWERHAGAQPRQLATRELDHRRGDFLCADGVVRLRPRVERDFLLWMGRQTRTEYLELSRRADALVATSTRHHDTYVLWVAGGTMRVETSEVSWARAP